MAKLFSFKALNLYPLKDYKSLILELREPTFNTRSIEELEIFFSWLCNHLEVNSVLITSNSSIFSRGLDLNEFKKLPVKSFEKILKRFQGLIYSMFFLPQTIVMDFKEMALEAGAEFGIGADIRIGRCGLQVNFDHLNKGLIPTCGGIGIIESIIPQTFVRKWILSANNISERDLLNSGYIHEFYDETNLDLSHKILKEINEQPPVPRIQAKRSLLESILPRIERAKEFESKFATAGMSIGDWKNLLENKKHLVSSPKDLAILLKADLSSKQ